MTSTTPPPRPALVAASDIEEAAARIAPLVRRTPVLTVSGHELDLDVEDVTVSLKLEYLQQSGTFKGRGATNFMLSQPIAAAGVTAASGGNHGAAVAWAAQQLGHRATIFVPVISAPAKVARLRSYGAEVVQVGAVYAESLDACRHHQAETGATEIHAYEHPAVFAGAGTTGRELDLQTRHDPGPLDAVLVACGGGGLAGGISAWFGDRLPLVACETHDTRAFAAAREAGQPVDVEVSGIAADALGATRIGTLAFASLTAAGATSALVDDDAVREARSWLWDRFRIVVEPSAAVPLAVLRARRWTPEPGSHVGVVVCGANTGLADLEATTEAGGIVG